MIAALGAFVRVSRGGYTVPPMQVYRGGCALHLSEHHGDGSPGAAVFLRLIGLRFNEDLR